MSPAPRRVALVLDLQWPYKRHSEIFAGIQGYAAEHGWVTVIDEFADDTIRRNRTAAGRYDGIVARVTLPLARLAAAREIPLVNVWPSSPARDQVPGVFPDSRTAGRLIAEHLLARGFRTFATLTSEEIYDNELEVQEFTAVVGRAGFACLSAEYPLEFCDTVEDWRKTERMFVRAMGEWVPPVGVYVGNEVCGRLLVQLCQQRGWRVPGDVAIVAGKNQEILCEHPHPSLTSLEIGYDRIGYAAAELLARLMDGRPPPADPVRIVPEGIVVRESTDFFAVDDDVVAAALAYIASHSHRRIGPGDVARAVSQETRTLQNYFRKALNRPIAAEIRRVRIERAKRELTQSDRGLAEIARAAGFGTIQRLYEVFRREVGMGPREYRNQRQMKG
ncbi:MAG: substrate-binding domain-containing protein [Fimbriiglobus sp.]